MSSEYEAFPERKEIEQETSAEVLCEWYNEASDLLDNIKAQIAAHNLFVYHDEESCEWASRARSKAGYAGTALRRIERRMIKIGLELPLNVDRKERQRIRFLEGLVGFLQRLCERNDIEHGTDPVVYSKGEEQ
jgi:hypothetical protein